MHMVNMEDKADGNGWGESLIRRPDGSRKIYVDK